MRIAIYHNVPFSGAKRTVFEQVKGLKSLGNEVDFYTTDREEGKDIFSSSNIADKVYCFEYNPLKLSMPLVGRLILDADVFLRLRFKHRRMAKHIDAKEYDIVICNIDVLTQAPYLLRFLKTKNVYFCLEPDRLVYEYSLRPREELGLLNKFYENIYRYFRKRVDLKNALSADHILAISLFGRERIIATYDRYPKISYLGVDEKIFVPKKVKKKRQILFVAEKHPIYGYDLAQSAMKLVTKEKNATFKMLAWRKENDERMSDPEVAEIYSESLVTLSLSKYDTFGLVPLESMACGTPVVALNVAGYRETMLSEKTGFLVDFDSRQIADKINLFLDNPGLAEEMGKEGRKWIEEKWTWSIQMKKLARILEVFLRDNA